MDVLHAQRWVGRLLWRGGNEGMEGKEGKLVKIWTALWVKEGKGNAVERCTLVRSCDDPYSPNQVDARILCAGRNYNLTRSVHHHPPGS